MSDLIKMSNESGQGARGALGVCEAAGFDRGQPVVEAWKWREFCVHSCERTFMTGKGTLKKANARVI